MIEVEIKSNGVTTTAHIPQHWYEVTVEDFIKLRNVDKVEWESPFDKDVAIISVLLNMNKDEVELMGLDEFNELVETLIFLKEDIEFPKLTDTIELDGKTWYIKKDFESMTVGERITFDIFVKGAADIDSQLDLFLTLFIKETGDETWLSSHKARRDIFKKLPFVNVRPIIDFFLTGISGSKVNTKHSSQKEKKIKVKKNEVDSTDEQK